MANVTGSTISNLSPEVAKIFGIPLDKPSNASDEKDASQEKK
ncbi:hypothetical protein [Candidatus Formimonas warabiya]|nr:hypothetical protein [Candidatus Formimonas warabiya]